MWQRFTSWLKGVFSLKREDIKEIAKGLETSCAMWNAQREWACAFYNEPDWCVGDYMTTKFPGIVTGYTATLCAAEMQINYGDGQRAEWVGEQVKRYVLSDIRNKIQLACALSFIVLKPYVKDNNIYCDTVTPESFFPTLIEGDTVYSGIFSDVEKVADKEYVRLEEHEWLGGAVRVTNKAYRKDSVKRGSEVALSSVKRWEDLEEEILVTDIERPLFAVLKMPFANQVDPRSKLPVSLYANAMQSFHEIDRLYNDFRWEMESGRRKQIFDISAVQPSRNPDRPLLPTDVQRMETTDQYIVLDMGGTVDKPYADYSPDMRVDAYQSALNIQLRLMETQLGVATGTFDFDMRSGVSRTLTATEVLADQTETYNTVKSIQENGIKQGLIDVIYIYNTYAGLYRLAPIGTVEPAIEFGDSVFEDTGTEFNRRKALADAGYYKPELLVAWYLGASEEAAKDMIPVPKAGAGLFNATPYTPGEDGL